MKHLPLILALVLGCGSVAAQGVYKCGNTYSQNPCAADAKPLDVGQAKPVVRVKDEATPEQRERSLERCQEAVRRRMKDPESTRFRDVDRLGPGEARVPAPRGQMTAVVSYSGWVNAKNAFGGYVGDRLFTCRLDRAEANVIDVVVLGE